MHVSVCVGGGKGVGGGAGGGGGGVERRIPVKYL